jgi:aspartate/methionine/tyrosine aminotransferase
MKLLEEAHVAVTPGVAFGPGGEGYVRFSLVEEVDRVDAACRAIAAVL